MRSVHDQRQKEADFLMNFFFFFYNELLIADNYSKEHFPSNTKFTCKIFLVHSVTLSFSNDSADDF